MWAFPLLRGNGWAADGYDRWKGGEETHGLGGYTGLSVRACKLWQLDSRSSGGKMAIY